MRSQSASYHGYRFPPDIISHAVWLYHRFCLSFRDAEDLLAQRGVTVTYETIRQWCQRFGPVYARLLRRRRGRMGDTWHLDEVFITIQGRQQYLWRAVDEDGDGHCQVAGEYPNLEPNMLSREQLPTATDWGLDATVSLKLTIPSHRLVNERLRHDQASRTPPLLRVRDDRVEDVGVPFDGEIETPGSIDPGLPQARGLVVLLGVQRRMLKVVGEEPLLLVECALHIRRRG